MKTCVLEKMLWELQQATLALNSCMDHKPAELKTTVIPADFLARVEFLPDGTATTDQQMWLKSWAEVAQLQVAKGIIKLQDVEEYDPDTGQVPNTFIKQIYIKNRRAH